MIERVALNGVTLINAQRLQEDLSSRIGCMDITEINALLERVTLAYVEAGYVTVRPYLPQQDLSGGEVTINVIEGQISRIELRENGVLAPRRAATAFPGMVGQPLELWRVEQGLTQINRLATSQAVSELRPGERDGESILLIGVTQQRPWQLSLTADNRGTETTGRHNFGVNFSYDNLLGLNDSWRVNYQRSTEPAPFAFASDNPVGQSLSLSTSVPYGPWSFGFTASSSTYVTQTQGVNFPIEVSGESVDFLLSIERVVATTESGRWDMGLSFAVADNENQVLGSRIDTASRRLAHLDLWLGQTQTVLGGQLQTTFTLRQGLDSFGAFDDDNAPEGSPVAQYRAVLLDMSWARQWDIGGQPIVLNSRISAQHSDDELFGSEQFSLGGFSGVRGTRTGVIFGNRGAEIVNTLSFPGAFQGGSVLSVTPYLGLDAGYIEQQDEYGIAGGRLSSWTIGTTFYYDALSLDITYSNIFDKSRGIEVPDGGLLTLQFGVRF